MEINDIRNSIDDVDAELLKLFIKRMSLIRQVGSVKRRDGIPIVDETRERRILSAKMDALSEKKDEEYAFGFFKELMRLSRLLQNRSRNIYLIGMPGSGKSTFAIKLKAKLNRLAVDIDEVIADRAGMTIKDIFARDGEEGFRKMEREVLNLVCAHGSMIVATGGGILTYQDNTALIKNSGITVLLDVPLDTLIKQDISARPLLHTTDDITALYYERYADYRNAADIIIDPEKSDALDRVSIFAADKLDIALDML
ncbi:MAG: shikimate kinase [Clostridia bacterium]